MSNTKVRKSFDGPRIIVDIPYPFKMSFSGVDIYRYKAVLMRQQFEENRCVMDQRVAKKLLEMGEEELFQKNHWAPRKFLFSILLVLPIQEIQWLTNSVQISFSVPEAPGGVAYLREVHPPDWILDYWHPLEKAQYPEYFARRELRKKEFVEMWQKKYGKSQATSDH
ncbi:hypothetical protein FQR65_LT08972 [Abscondita terminalis]|nr:hypothetical protein FQR65_LT08972 [Abscondita terminalis]